MDSEARFEFGENWRRFLTVVNEQRIAEAEKSLQTLLGLMSLAGKTFLDIGCGSGLFSLAAQRLGASVRSMDYDPGSVACARELKKRYAPDATRWVIEQGSILDEAYITRVGTYDIVYSWGVLHHTGAMWRGVGHAARLVKPQGLLAIALYNDQGLRSRAWRGVKKLYNKLPPPIRPVYAGLFFLPLWVPRMVKESVQGKLFDSYRNYASHRGMSPWYDLVDWVGGLPYEVASSQAVTDYGRAHNLDLVRLVQLGGLGCNEYVFRSGKIEKPTSGG